MSDRAYNLMFPQPEIGLSELGRTTITTMAQEGILVDITHMSQRAIDETFTLLDEIDPDRKIPIAATHVGFRFSHHEYMLSSETIERIAQRSGMIGIIYSDHLIKSGLRHRRTRTFEQSFKLMCCHIDRIRAITGSHDYTALGSDLDGYIKPTLAGLESASGNRQLEQALIERYGEEDGAKICSGTALRVLNHGWRGATAAPEPQPVR